jgi:hypothetical protein
MGRVNTDRAVDGPLDDDPMPVFTIKGQDRLALETIEAYWVLCKRLGLHQQADEVSKALDEMRAWQNRNPGRMKLPDHEHRPAGETALGYPILSGSGSWFVYPVDRQPDPHRAIAAHPLDPPLNTAYLGIWLDPASGAAVHLWTDDWTPEQMAAAGWRKATPDAV